MFHFKFNKINFFSYIFLILTIVSCGGEDNSFNKTSLPLKKKDLPPIADIKISASLKYLKIDKTIPNDLQKSVSIKSQIAIYFDKELDPKQSINLLVGFYPFTKAVIEIKNKVLFFKPKTSLLNGQIYTLKISNKIKSLNGLNLEKDYIFSFKTSEETKLDTNKENNKTETETKTPERQPEQKKEKTQLNKPCSNTSNNKTNSSNKNPNSSNSPPNNKNNTILKKWRTPILLEKTNTQAFYPKAAILDNGTALAIWQQPHSKRERMWFNTFGLNSINTWDTEALIDPAATSFTGATLKNKLKNTMAIWYSMGPSNIWQVGVSHYSKGKWTTLKRLNALANKAIRPKLALNENGEAIAAWVNYKNSKMSLWSSFYDGKTWSSPQNIRTSFISDNNVHVEVTLDENGNSTAVWPQKDDKTKKFDIWAARLLKNKTSWSNHLKIEKDDSDHALLPKVKVNLICN